MRPACSGRAVHCAALRRSAQAAWLVPLLLAAGPAGAQTPEQVAAAAKAWPDLQLAAKLAAGTTTNCFDGQPFFYNAHPVDVDNAAGVIAEAVEEQGRATAEIAQSSQQTSSGVASLGVRPTVEPEGKPILEVFLFDFEDSIYGHRITVEFLHKLRDEAHYPDLDALTRQIRADVAQAREFFAARG